MKVLRWWIAAMVAGGPLGLAEVRGRLRLPVERDHWFTAAGLLSAYATAARRAERIVELEAVA